MKRTVGHPPLDEDDATVGVYVSLPAKQFEDYRKRAAHDDVSIPEIIRRDLYHEKRDVE